MGLLLDIVFPASEVLFRLERRGMPLDAQRRKELADHTEARAVYLRAQIIAAAGSFHEVRLTKIQTGIDALVIAKAAIEEHAAACSTHPTYRGLRKLSAKRTCDECRTLWTWMRVQREGHASFQKRIAVTRSFLRRLGPAFRPGSPDDWRAWLFSVEGLGLTAIDRTLKTQKPSIDDESIEALWKRNPEVGVLRQRVELSHLENKLNGPLAVEADANGRVHFVYSLHRTANGQVASGLDRYESDKPRASAGNAQNITETMRQIFAAEPGMAIVHVDYAQIESRIMAWLSRCEKMMRAFLAGVDIHALNAAAIFGCAPDQARTTLVRFGGTNVSARYAAKRATHGWDYGMGDFKTARLYGLTIAEARRARMAYFAAWPELVAFQDEVMRRVERDKFLRNAFGRKLRFYGFAFRDGRWQTTEREEAIAFPVASTAKDIAKSVLAPLDAVSMEIGCELLTTTHDSFTFQAPKDRVWDLIARCTLILVRPWAELGVWHGMTPSEFFCPIEWSIGANWADAHEHSVECGADCDKENRDGLRKAAECTPYRSRA